LGTGEAYFLGGGKNQAVVQGPKILNDGLFYLGTYISDDSIVGHRNKDIKLIVEGFFKISTVFVFSF